MISTAGSLAYLNSVAMVKVSGHFGLYCKTIKNLMTEKHRQVLLDGCAFKEFGAFCLTELGHGSNVRAMETTATYDTETKEFVLNSPTETSLKFWIGSLGKTACMAVVLARLYTKGVDYGVHAFVVNIRDKATHLPHAGLEIGECGPKKGINGMDTGFIKFNNFRVHKDSLLDRFGQVADDGTYSSPIKSNGKRFAYSIACLTAGRMIICRGAIENSAVALIIALRYAFVRRQFGPLNQEKQLINYPSHQYRLFPRFAESIVGYISTLWMMTKWKETVPNLFEKGNKDPELCHGLSSVLKAFTSWIANKTIHECRQACGSNGYTQYAMFGRIEEVNDLNQTWEGDNNVLLMQAQRFLLNSLKAKMNDENLPETLEFLTDEMPEVQPFKGDINDIKALRLLIATRANYSVHNAAQKLMADPSKSIEVFNDIQPFELTDMCRAYYDYYNADRMEIFLAKIEDEKTKEVFTNVYKLHLLHTINEQSNYYSQVFTFEQFAEIRDAIMTLCGELRKDILLLTYIFPFPNISLGPLGNEDMQVYKRLKIMRENAY